MRKAVAVMLLACGVVGGCGTQVTLLGRTVSEGKSQQKPAPETADPAAAKAAPIVRDVLLSLNASLQQQVKGDARFDDQALRLAIAAELRTRGLMGPEDSTAGNPIDILVDEYSLVPSSSAVIGAKQPMAGTLSGLVRVLDADGKEQRSFKVRAQTSLQLAAKGKTPDELAGLYGRFAVLAAEGLATR